MQSEASGEWGTGSTTGARSKLHQQDRLVEEDITNVVKILGTSELQRIHVDMSRSRLFRKNVLVQVLLDMGVSKSVVSSDIVRRLGLSIDQSSTTLYNASGEQMSVKGTSQIWLYINGYRYWVNALVTDSLGDEEFILGIHELTKTQLIPLGWPWCILPNHSRFAEEMEELSCVEDRGHNHGGDHGHNPGGYADEKKEELRQSGKAYLNLADSVFHDLGDLEDTPRLSSLPTAVQEVLIKYREVFTLTLDKDRRIKMELV